MKKSIYIVTKRIIHTLLLFSCIFIISCSPSKESYLEDYQTFMTNYSKENENYTETDWKKSDKKFAKFSKERKDKYKENFTWKEELVLAKHEFLYGLGKIKRESKGFFDSFLNEDFVELKKQIQYYKENEMKDDIEFIIKEAEKLEGTAKETLSEIFKELEIEFNQFQKMD